MPTLIDDDSDYDFLSDNSSGREGGTENMEARREAEKKKPLHKDCIICEEAKPVVSFPKVDNPPCSHINDICFMCISRSITAQIESRSSESIQCPLCENSLNHALMAAYASPADFER